MNKEELIRKKNVVLIIGGKKEVGGAVTGRDAVRVGVTKKVPMFLLKRKDQVPKKVDGIETDVFVTGEISALAIDRTARHRPAPGGVSVGHPDVTAGTLGMVIRDQFGVPLILSNNHVLANCNDAEEGDQTWQPGKADGGGLSDQIGRLTKFALIHFEDDESTCPIAGLIVGFLNLLAKFAGRKTRLVPRTSESNKVDCAISQPLDFSDVSEEILELGKPIGFADAKIGGVIKKSGRTSAVNSGTVQSIDGIARVGYGSGKVAVFTDQIITSAIASPGDSGSVVLNENNEVVGLLFAGSDTLTIVNKISNVIEALGL